MLLYRQLKRWPECSALSRKLLLKNPDDWQFYLSYFDSLFHLIDQSWTPPEEGDHCIEGEVHSSVAQAISFVEERLAAEDGKESRPLRGPYLARLELIQRLRQRSCSQEQQLGEPLELMFQFFVKFGDKPCCITDLKVFLDLIVRDQHVQFINRLTEAVPLGAANEAGMALPGDTRSLQRHLCVTQLGRCLGLQHTLGPDGKLALIQELKHHYRHGLQFGKSCLKTELQFSDMYCLMAAHVYIDLWIETGDEQMLWQCLGLLEEGLSRSPSNAQFKLLLLLLYCRLGAFEPVVDLYSSLDAKHIQHDTIGYLLTRYAESLGQFAAASQSCNFSLRFFHSNQKDTSEYIIQAYKYGAFEKIPEFIAFRNRLNNSLHFAQVRTERMLLDLFLEADISSTLEEILKSMSLCPEEDDIPWDNIRDNRDLTVFVSWNPKDRQLNEEDRQRSLEEELLWLKIRSLTLRLVCCLSSLCHPPSLHNSEKTAENGVCAKPSTLQPLLSLLENTLSQAAQFTEKHSQGSPQLIFRLHRALSSASFSTTPATFMSSLTTSMYLLYGLRRFRVPGSSILNILLPTCSASLLRMCPYHLSLISLSLIPKLATCAVPLMCSFLILSNLNILNSATSNFASCLFVKGTVSNPYITAALTTVLHILPFTFAGTFLSQTTPEILLQLLHPACTLSLSFSPHYCSPHFPAQLTPCIFATLSSPFSPLMHMYSVLLLLTFIPLRSSVYLHLSKPNSTSFLLSPHITISSANIMFHGDSCLTSSVKLSITMANKKGLKADP
ncbi:N-alpha-acetyltransferase 25, NatB auxiliary subunit isoform X3 [Neoarius graeffei]|nr:N-alpha-acetyltransferase 25, NatB auxiliary subunit isoform X3 [Neoarius graeffei]